MIRLTNKICSSAFSKWKTLRNIYLRLNKIYILLFVFCILSFIYPLNSLMLSNSPFSASKTQNLHLLLNIFSNYMSVKQLYDSMGFICVTWGMCYHNYGCTFLVQFGKQIHNFLSVS